METRAGDAGAAVGGHEVSEDAIWRFATALARAVTTGDIAEAMAEQGADAAGAAFSNMAVLDDSGNVHLVHGSVLPSEVASRWVQLDLDDPTPLCDAILIGEAVLLPTLEAVADRYPALVEDTVASSLQATASVPLRATKGDAVGALGFGWSEPQAFDDALLHRLDLISHLVAQALERAEVFHGASERASAERIEALTLQQAFLPPQLPVSPDLEMAAAYLPASDSPLGGDWYDAFGVDGRVCMIVGDVAGHGARAAAVMGQLRNVARGFADEDPSPGRVLQRLNRMLYRLDPDDTATAIAAVYDPATRTLVTASAGHLPALVAANGQPVAAAASQPGIMLGVEPDSTYDEHTSVLPEGTTLLLYTDGLVETRRQGIDEGIDRLTAFLHEVADLPPRVLCDRVLEWRLQAGHREDDMCVLVVRTRCG